MRDAAVGRVPDLRRPERSGRRVLRGVRDPAPGGDRRYTATGLAGGWPATPAPVTTAVAAERRLVSVLFADLVGFTPFAEERDAEDVRDTL